MIRGGGTGNNADDATSAAQKQHYRHTNSNKDNRTDKSTSSKPSKSTPKPKKNTKSSSRIVNDIMKETDYFKILGLDREDIPRQGGKSTVVVDAMIQKAYRKRALQTHPDKTGGDRQAFDKVAEAYDVLQDENKRTIYTKYGKRGLEGGMGSRDRKSVV